MFWFIFKIPVGRYCHRVILEPLKEFTCNTCPNIQGYHFAWSVLCSRESIL